MAFHESDVMNIESDAADARGRIALAGATAAGAWISGPAWASWLIMIILGEGDYILVVAAAMWVALFLIGLWMRASAEMGTVQRARGLWIAAASGFLAIVLAGAALASFAAGE